MKHLYQAPFAEFEVIGTQDVLTMSLIRGEGDEEGHVFVDGNDIY